MILLALYAIAIWFAAYRCRRSWRGWLVVAGGTPIIPLVAHVDVQLVEFLTGENLWFLYIPALGFALVTAAIGAIQALQPLSLPEHACSTCSYDLLGNVLGVCPECGEPVSEPAHPSQTLLTNSPRARLRAYSAPTPTPAPTPAPALAE